MVISGKSEAPAETIVKLGLIPILGTLIDRPKQDEISMKINKIFGNIAATTHSNVLELIKEGIHLKLIRILMESNDPKIQDQVEFILIVVFMGIMQYFR